jgi:hypothetical protein
MRSLKKLSGVKVCGMQLMIDGWYMVKFHDSLMSDYWVVQFGGLLGGVFYYKKTAYSFKIGGVTNKYPSNDGISYPLCDVGDICSIKRVRLSELKDYSMED